MAEIPSIKPPRDFTGDGLERIGDPKNPHLGLLRYRDGKFIGLSFPDSIDPSWTPETAQEWSRVQEIDAVEDCAEKVRAGEANLDDLRSLLPGRSKINDDGRKQFLERAAKRILKGGERSDSPIRNRLALAATRALMETSKELRRPPAEWEVVRRMRQLEDDRGKVTENGNDRDLKDAIRDLGFPWLERRRRGYQGER